MLIFCIFFFNLGLTVGPHIFTACKCNVENGTGTVVPYSVPYSASSGTIKDELLWSYYYCGLAML